MGGGDETASGGPSPDALLQHDQALGARPAATAAAPAGPLPTALLRPGRPTSYQDTRADAPAAPAVKQLPVAAQPSPVRVNGIAATSAAAQQLPKSSEPAPSSDPRLQLALFVLQSKLCDRALDTVGVVDVNAAVRAVDADNRGGLTTRHIRALLQQAGFDDADRLATQCAAVLVRHVKDGAGRTRGGVEATMARARRAGGFRSSAVRHGVSIPRATENAPPSLVALVPASRAADATLFGPAPAATHSSSRRNTANTNTNTDSNDSTATAGPAGPRPLGRPMRRSNDEARPCPPLGLDSPLPFTAVAALIRNTSPLGRGAVPSAMQALAHHVMRLRAEIRSLDTDGSGGVCAGELAAAAAAAGVSVRCGMRGRHTFSLTSSSTWVPSSTRLPVPHSSVRSTLIATALCPPQSSPACCCGHCPSRS